jgi:hypothetical protein
MMLGNTLIVAIALVSAPHEKAPQTKTETSIADHEHSEIVVTGRSEHRIGTALSASEGVVSGAELRVRPLLRTSELAEAVPGMIAVQHSGGGKAAQYLIRRARVSNLCELWARVSLERRSRRDRTFRCDARAGTRYGV